MSKSAQRAERIALAIINGDVSANEHSFDQLKLANREREVEQQVTTLRKFRNGDTVWSVPAQAPWAGF